MSDIGLTFPAEAKRKRLTIPINGAHSDDEPASLSQNAARVAQGIENLQGERDGLRRELDTANARIEQFESNETRLISDIESERARTSAAKAEAEQARADKVRLETMLIASHNRSGDVLGVAQ